MPSLKRKRNLLDDKQKREIISYAKENPKLTQQIADNLTIKYDHPIKRTVGDILKNVCQSSWNNLRKFIFSFNTWLPVFNVPQFIAKLVILPNYRLHRRWRFNEGSLYLYGKKTIKNLHRFTTTQRDHILSQSIGLLFRTNHTISNQNIDCVYRITQMTMWL